ncbi:hypothetical protein C8Q79DRAFT_415517 [Trametes meyenii]|nr:hypothetical protein C8Q79DRAFT_415517 [Trametes meyenii]
MGGVMKESAQRGLGAVLGAWSGEEWAQRRSDVDETLLVACSLWLSSAGAFVGRRKRLAKTVSDPSRSPKFGQNIPRRIRHFWMRLHLLWSFAVHHGGGVRGRRTKWSWRTEECRTILGVPRPHPIHRGVATGWRCTAGFSEAPALVLFHLNIMLLGPLSVVGLLRKWPRPHPAQGVMKGRSWSQARRQVLLGSPSPRGDVHAQIYKDNVRTLVSFSDSGFDRDREARIRARAPAFGFYPRHRATRIAGDTNILP